MENRGAIFFDVLMQLFVSLDMFARQHLFAMQCIEFRLSQNIPCHFYPFHQHAGVIRIGEEIKINSDLPITL
ncbi:hypothetical protein D3C73_1059340 [compost metagenome]